MKRNNINPQRTSVAATFYEPVYQRLRSWTNDTPEYLLGFTVQTNAHTRHVLENAGAVLCQSQTAVCFTEVWKLTESFEKLSAESLCELDRQIVNALRCHHGRSSAACGHLRWDDIAEEPHRRHHVISQLVQESREPRTQAR